MEFTVECPVYESFRVAQINGMFDMANSTDGDENASKHHRPVGI